MSNRRPQFSVDKQCKEYARRSAGSVAKYLEKKIKEEQSIDISENIINLKKLANSMLLSRETREYISTRIENSNIDIVDLKNLAEIALQEIRDCICVNTT